MIQRLEVRCLCGRFGRLTWTGRLDDEGKRICTFVCSCDEPKVDFEEPFRGWDP